MKSVIAWIKTNPISVVSFALMLLSLGAIAYFLFVAKPPVLDNASATAEKALRDAKIYMSKTIDVPPLNADDPPEQVSNVTINPATIRVMSNIYGDLNRESEQTFESAKQINRPGHDQMIPDLFPEADLGKAFQARSTYLRLLEAMVGGPRRAAEVAEATGVDIPYLNAGPPLSSEHISRFLAQQAEAYQQESGGNTRTAPAAEGDTQFQAEQRRQLVNELLRHAQGISVYATPDLGNPQQPLPGFPLRVASLGVSTEAPTPSQLWEGQLELWILSDIVHAIGLVNDVAKQRNPDANVLNAPIKRLLDIEVLSGYVGLHNTGGVDRVGGAVGRGGGNTRTSRGPAGFSPPAGGMTDQSAETPLSDNFAFGPTGRSSNHLFDVRHVRVLMHADFQRLPEFFNALARVNLMTPLNMRVTALDEYQLLNENFIYGQGDVVEVEIIIETLWLRDWTSELMPEDVKVYVGLADPPEGETPGMDGGYGGEFGGYGGEFGGDYGEYGGY